MLGGGGNRCGTSGGGARWNAMTNGKRQRLTAIEAVDLRLARFLGIDRRKAGGRWTARFAELGDQPPMMGLSLATVAAGLATRNPRLRQTGLRMVAAHALSTAGKSVVKNLIDRTRPRALGDNDYRMQPGQSGDKELRSMPSGHSAGAVALAGAVGDDFPRAAPAAAVGAALLAGAQLPTRNHFLSDVAVGSLIGIAASLAARKLVPAIDRVGA